MLILALAAVCQNAESGLETLLAAIPFGGVQLSGAFPILANGLLFLAEKPGLG